jgi:hypothetical protein
VITAARRRENLGNGRIRPGLYHRDAHGPSPPTRGVEATVKPKCFASLGEDGEALGMSHLKQAENCQGW